MAMFIQSKADSAKNTSPAKTEKKDLSFTKDYMNDTPFINSAISDNKVVFCKLHKQRICYKEYLSCAKG